MQTKQRIHDGHAARLAFAPPWLTICLAVCALFAFVVAGCGSEGAQPTPHPIDSFPIVDQDLALGSRGGEVRVLHDYLTRFGYFPNAGLERQYPAWRPIVSEPPAAEDLFDEHTAAAVRALQANMALPATGIVDGATREVLRTPRCGVPEGIAVGDPSEKFALDNFKWDHTSLTYGILTANSPFTLDQMRSIASLAFSAWTNQTSVSVFFQQTRPDITIQFGMIDGPYFAIENGGCHVHTNQTTVGGTDPPGSTIVDGRVVRVITLDQTERWIIGGGGCAIDPQGVLTHEIGHALGLLHSNAASAVMRPKPETTDATDWRSLKVDDDVAISSWYDQFHAKTATNPQARDIGVGPDGSVWIINSNPWGDGFRVAKYNGFCCFDESDGGAVRVAVGPEGIPWVVTAQGLAYRHSSGDPASGVWQFLNGSGSDLGVGYNGDAWIVGMDHVVWKFNGNLAAPGWLQDHLLRNAVKVTVGPSGVPYILDSANHFWRYSNSDPGSGTWVSIPGLSNDLAIGPGNYLWSVGGPVGAGLVSLSVWDEQSQLGAGPPAGAPAKSEWAPPGGLRPSSWGSFTNVAVGPTGNVWFIDGSGFVWTSDI